MLSVEDRPHVPALQDQHATLALVPNTPPRSLTLTPEVLAEFREFQRHKREERSEDEIPITICRKAASMRTPQNNGSTSASSAGFATVGTHVVEPAPADDDPLNDEGEPTGAVDEMFSLMDAAAKKNSAHAAKPEGAKDKRLKKLKELAGHNYSF